MYLFALTIKGKYHSTHSPDHGWGCASACCFWCVRERGYRTCHSSGKKIPSWILTVCIRCIFAVAYDVYFCGAHGLPTFVGAISIRLLAILFKPFLYGYRAAIWQVDPFDSTSWWYGTFSLQTYSWITQTICYANKRSRLWKNECVFGVCIL